MANAMGYVAVAAARLK